MAVKTREVQGDKLPTLSHQNVEESDDDSISSVDEEGEESIHEDDSDNPDENDDDGDDEQDDEDDGDGDDSGDGEEDNEMSGWADAMAKVLNTGKKITTTENRSLFLSKALKDKNAAPESIHAMKGALKRAKKNEIDSICRSKPNLVSDRARERHFTKLATKGVVQLFNAVREQQKTIKSQLNAVGNSVTKREKVFKNIDKEGFLEVLSGKRKRSTPNEGESSIKKNKSEVKEEIKSEAGGDEEVEESSWKILRDDFMMGAKMKDWDKESESDG